MAVGVSNRWGKPALRGERDGPCGAHAIAVSMCRFMLARSESPVTFEPSLRQADLNGAFRGLAGKEYVEQSGT